MNSILFNPLLYWYLLSLSLSERIVKHSENVSAVCSIFVCVCVFFFNGKTIRLVVRWARPDRKRKLYVLFLLLVFLRIRFNQMQTAINSKMRHSIENNALEIRSHWWTDECLTRFLFGFRFRCLLEFDLLLRCLLVSWILAGCITDFLCLRRIKHEEGSNIEGKTLWLAKRFNFQKVNQAKGNFEGWPSPFLSRYVCITFEMRLDVDF